MNEKNEQQENDQDSMIDLEVSDEQADQARAGAGDFKSEWKYVPVR